MLASSSLSGKAVVLDKEPVKEQMNRMLVKLVNGYVCILISDTEIA